jgi:TIR domain
MDQTPYPWTAPNRIFMSYRRQETEYPAGWLFDRLAEHFRGAEVFKDVDSIEPGDDFVDVITRAVESCDVLLALIGDRWLTMTDGEGRRRIDDPDDYVRVEIEAALSRNVRVVPILVYGAKMPRAHDLPDSLAGLVRRQALELTATRFDEDLTRLLKVLDRTLAEVRDRPAINGTAVADVAATPPAQQAPRTPHTRQNDADVTQRKPHTAGVAHPGRPSGGIDTAAPPDEADRDARRGTAGLSILSIPAIATLAAAVIIAIIVGGVGVWAWQRGKADSGSTHTTGGPSAGASPSTSANSTATAPALVWQSVPGAPGGALPGAAAVAYKGEIWVAEANEPTMRVYDPAGKSWRDGAPLPRALSHGSLVSDGQHLFYIGGISGDDWGLRTVYRLDSPDGAWTEDSPLPEGRFSGAAVWDGRRILYGGGAAKRSPRTAESDVWALTSEGWARLGVLPNPREHLAATTDGRGTVWFVGGADVRAGTLSEEVDKVSGSTIKQSGSLPKPVQGMSAAWSSASGVCAMGGSTTPPNANAKQVAKVTCLGGRAWPDLPQPTYFPLSATLDDTVYVVAADKMFLLHVTP